MTIKSGPVFILKLVCIFSTIKCVSNQVMSNKVYEKWIHFNYVPVINLLNIENIGQPYTVNTDFKSNESFSADCSIQLQELTNGLERQELWALKMLDAWGKIPAGILYGHGIEMGNFDECLAVKEVSVGQGQLMQGKYCLSLIPLSKLHIDSLQIGICLPAICSANEIETVLRESLKHVYNLSSDTTLLTEENCTKDAPLEFMALDWVVVTILIVLAMFVVFSTCYDYWGTYQDKILHPLWASFSVRKNALELLQIKHSHISCINGIRCLSLIWIVFLHCYMFLFASPNINTTAINDWNHTPFSMIDQSGSIAVDSFFFISGLLLLLLQFKSMERNNGNMNVLKMYVHRYLRLTPVLVMSMLLFMTLFRYVGNGPLWKSLTSSYKLCDNTWWMNLLYVQNYAAAGKMCLGHSWYLAVDTQLYFLSPIFLYIIWKWRNKGIAAIVVFGLLLVACLFSIIIINDFSFLDIVRNQGAHNDIMPKIYYSTHTRTSPWLVGMIFGYFLHCRNGRIASLSKLTVLLGWLISLTIFFTVVFSWYPTTLPNSHDINALETAFYVSLGRVAWPLALCWVVFACTNNYGGPINKLLSLSLWQVLAKLSFSMYILHLLVINVNTARVKTNTYFSDYDVMLNFWSNYGTTILISICMYLMVEAPFTNIERHLLAARTAENPTTKQMDNGPANSISKQNLCD